MAEITAFPGVDPSRIERRRQQPPLIEPALAPEFFVSELSRIDVYGSFARLIFSTPDIPLDGDEGAQARVVNAKLVLPSESLRAIRDAIDARLTLMEQSAKAEQTSKDNPS